MGRGSLAPDRASSDDSTGSGFAGDTGLAHKSLEIHPCREQTPWHGARVGEVPASFHPGMLIGLVLDIEGELRLQHVHPERDEARSRF